jgi:hypothetical protein
VDRDHRVKSGAPPAADEQRLVVEVLEVAVDAREVIDRRAEPGQCSDGGVPPSDPPLEPDGGAAVPVEPEPLSGVVPPLPLGGPVVPEVGALVPVCVPEPGVEPPLVSLVSGAATPPAAPELVCDVSGTVETGVVSVAGATTGAVVAICSLLGRTAAYFSRRSVLTAGA